MQVLDEIAKESGLEVLSDCVAQLLDTFERGQWQGVVTTADTIRLLSAGGVGRNSATIRSGVKWLLDNQNEATGSWNDEVLDTTAALRALNTVGGPGKADKAIVKAIERGVEAVCGHFDEDVGSWWDIWETCQVVDCFSELGVEPDKRSRALTWIVSKRYIDPPNWLNAHTTAAALDSLAHTDSKYDKPIIEAKEWLFEHVRAKLDTLDEWTLALTIRALYRYQDSHTDSLCKSAVGERLAPAIRDNKFGPVDLTQIGLTLLSCAPILIAEGPFINFIDGREKYNPDIKKDGYPVDSGSPKM